MIKRIILRILLALGLVIFNITASKVSEGVLIENCDPERVALLVADAEVKGWTLIWVRSCTQ